MKTFNYHSAKDSKEASKLSSSNSVFLAGGMTTIPSMKLGLASYKDIIDIKKIKKPQELEDLDLLVLKGEFGVAENGAIWITDDHFPIRVLPFITKDLVLVIDKTDIVPYMHQAYNRLKDIDYNFGLFLSGPSKTADIEQSLVIGAQGALSLSVFLLN